MRLLVFLTVLAISGASPVIYRISALADPGDVQQQGAAAGVGPEGRWIPVQGSVTTGQEGPRRTVQPEQQLRAGPCPHALGQQQVLVGQQSAITPGYAYTQPSYPTTYPYVYYYQYPGLGQVPQVPIQQQQQVLAQQPLRPPSAFSEQYPKQGLFYQATATTTQKPVAPTGLPPPPPPPPVSGPAGGSPTSGGAWQQYICSLFPYLSSCQPQQQQPPQQQQQLQLLQPQQQQAPLSYPYGFTGFGGYSGYQQMAQFPVYYIVQTEARPQPNIMLPPGTVGIIRITGPTSIRPEEEAVVKQEVKPELDTVVVGGESGGSGGGVTTEVKTESERRPEETKQEVPKESSQE